MKPLAVVLVCLFVSSASAYGVVALTAADAAPAPDATLDAARVAQLEQDLATLTESLQRLQADQQAARLGASAREATAPLAAAADDELVTRVAEHVLAQLRAGGDPEAAPSTTIRSADDAVANLLEIGLWGDAGEAYWNEIYEAGVFDDVVAAFERIAKENPNDADAQFHLGQAYGQAAMRATPGQQAGPAMQADRAYDEALDINPEHWGARFSKAVAYSFWPPVLGKGKAAIDHFEILVEQQERGAVEEHHAHTYVFLGNMYAQQGDAEKAAEIWGRGAALHPGNTDLKSKIAGK